MINLKKNKEKKILLYLLLDKSSSMLDIRNDFIKSVNQQLSKLQEEAASTKIVTELTIIEFNNKLDYLHAGDITNIIPEIDEDSYTPTGGTAINDAIIRAIDLSNFDIDKNKDKFNCSVVILTITDGIELHSTNSRSITLHTVNTSKATGKYTFIGCGPSSSKHYFMDIGFPSGNIDIWEASKEGLVSLTSKNTTGITRLYKSYSSGSESVSDFFKLDVDSIPKSVVSSNLKLVTNEYSRYHIPLDTTQVSIRDVVKNITKRNYTVGSAYYQLTKIEKVQNYKDIVLMNNDTLELYTSDNIRSLLRIPEGKDIILKPGMSITYSVYVKSTSWNRKLVPGTHFLLRK